MTTTYVIQGISNTVIKHKALIYKAKRPLPISQYGRVILYKRR